MHFFASWYGVSRQGVEQPIAAPLRLLLSATFARRSPVAVTLVEEEQQLWLYDLTRGGAKPILVWGRYEQNAVWTPDVKADSRCSEQGKDRFKFSGKHPGWQRR